MNKNESQEYTFSMRNGAMERKIVTRIGLGMFSEVKLKKEKGNWTKTLYVKDMNGRFMWSKSYQVENNEAKKLGLKVN